MTNTKNRLKEYWDNVVLKRIPPHAQFHKVEDELKEHYTLLMWAWKSFLLPLILLYFILGLIFQSHILGSLFLSLLVFLYSNFLPDSDILINRPQNNEKESLWYEIYFLLCFAPLVLYYIVKGKATPLYSTRPRPFHNLKTAIVWGAFLLIIASLFWPDDLLKKLMLPLFGMAGFSFHLMVDGIINLFWIKNKPPVDWSKEK
ncbi:MAG: hypothetical protein IT215_05275 [Chitinophagaceae bacterium]|nr:hypothetical protein [Chitinophagaceae bacterium]